MKSLLTNSRLRAVIVMTILLLTAFLFIRFFVLHPQYLTALTHLSATTIIGIILLNILGLVLLVGINSCLLRFCGVNLGWLEQFQLTSYSAIANFFGPLQSGPGVRAVYLKAKHGVRLRDYTLASLIYYASFALISAVFLFGISRSWWQAVLLILAVALSSWAVIRLFRQRDNVAEKSGFRFTVPAFVGLLVLTVLQVAVIALWYYIELRAVASGTTLRQAFIYAGAANFALFVSLTPDAIGFREAFLVLAQKLHGISTAAIISANLLDRAVYAAFLGGLFLLVLATHARDRFKVEPRPAVAERR